MKSTQDLLAIHNHALSGTLNADTCPFKILAGINEFVAVSTALTMEYLYPYIKSIFDITIHNQIPMELETVKVVGNISAQNTDVIDIRVFDKKTGKSLSRIKYTTDLSQIEERYAVEIENLETQESVAKIAWRYQISDEGRFAIYPKIATDVNYHDLSKILKTIAPVLNIMLFDIPFPKAKYHESIKDLLWTDLGVIGENCLKHYDNMISEILMKYGFLLCDMNLRNHNTLSFENAKENVRNIVFNDDKSFANTKDRTGLTASVHYGYCTNPKTQYLVESQIDEEGYYDGLKASKSTNGVRKQLFSISPEWKAIEYIREDMTISDLISIVNLTRKLFLFSKLESYSEKKKFTN